MKLHFKTTRVKIFLFDLGLHFDWATLTHQYALIWTLHPSSHLPWSASLSLKKSIIWAYFYHHPFHWCVWCDLLCVSGDEHRYFPPSRLIHAKKFICGLIWPETSDDVFCVPYVVRRKLITGLVVFIQQCISFWKSSINTRFVEVKTNTWSAKLISRFNVGLFFFTYV